MTIDEHRAEALRAYCLYQFHRHTALALEHRAQGRDASAASHEASARDFASAMERHARVLPRSAWPYPIG